MANYFSQHPRERSPVSFPSTTPRPRAAVADARTRLFPRGQLLSRIDLAWKRDPWQAS
jgi:hypothetical protein